jgi:hypothetical protein
MAERILDAFPSGSYAVSGLLRLLDIVETDKVSSAAVECKIQPRLLINPDFVKAHAESPEKLLMLVMHELHHVLLGHTVLFPRATRVQNFILDAVINGIICRMFPRQAYTSFFSDLYSSERFPECLLRPPVGWYGKQGERPAALESVPENLRPRVREVHEALYQSTGASYQEVYDVLPVVLAAVGAGGTADGKGLLIKEIPLLGSHDDEIKPSTGSSHQEVSDTPLTILAGPQSSGAMDAGESCVSDIPLLGSHDVEAIPDGQPDRLAPLLVDMMRELVERWPQTPDPIRGRSLADLLKSTTVCPRREPSNRAILRRLIRKVANAQGPGRVREVCDDRMGTFTPLPTMARRSLVLRALGAQTLLHPGTAPWRHRVATGDKVRVYLDVSGSMEEVLTSLYGAVLDCQEMVHPTVYLFSTSVTDVSLAELRAGKCESTGGTAIDCVAEHMARNKVRRALIITDGWVGTPAGEHHDTLANSRLAVAYLGNSTNQEDLQAVANHTTILKIGV